MKQTTNTADKKKMLRRSLAVFCAVCLVMVQCFVVLPAVTGEVHAASSLDFTAIYKGDFRVTETNSKWISNAGTKKFTITVETEEEQDGEMVPVTKEVEVTGRPLSTILKNASLSDNSGVNIIFNDDSGCEVDASNTYLVKDGDSWLLYDDVGPISENHVDGVEVTCDRNPVKFSEGPKSDNKKPTVGDTITISYKLAIDTFFKNSEEYENNSEKYTTLNWSGNDKVSLNKKQTTGTSGSITAKVKKAGDIKITAKSNEFGDVTKSATPSAKKKPTTKKTTTKATTRYTYTTRRYSGSTYRPYRPTTRSGVSGSTRSSVTTTATRPTETASTAKPSFQTMTVKEVYLNEVMPEEEVYYDEYGNPIEEDEWSEEEEGTENDFDEDGVSFPAAAGSAAMAVAACGAGIVGRVRKFHIDMGTAAVAKIAKTAADGGSKAGKGAKEAKAAKEGKAAGEAKASKETRNPLKKLRKK